MEPYTISSFMQELLDNNLSDQMIEVLMQYWLDGILAQDQMRALIMTASLQQQYQRASQSHRA